MELVTQFFGNLFYGFVVLAFIAAVLLLEGLYLTWTAYKGPAAKRIARRLRAVSAVAAAVQASILKQPLAADASALQRLLRRLPRVQALERLLHQSGCGWTLSFFAGLTVAFAAGAFFAASLLPLLHWLFKLAIAFGAALLPMLYVVHKRSKRMFRIVQQLPDALDLMSRALKAGHAFPSGLQMVAEETQEPIASEFRMVHDEVNFGVAMPSALANFANRVPMPDVRHFVIAVLIQRESGGNLTELLANISALIRERMKLLLKVRVLSAEGRLSAIILCALPFAVAGIVNLVNPKFMSVLWTDPMGLNMIYGALTAMVLGALWMRKIIRIRA
jgi:tight adherence protein B